MNEENKKPMAYSQTKIEIRRLIMNAIKEGRKQKRDILINPLCEMIELDLGVGNKAIHRIIDILEHLGFIKNNEGILVENTKKTPKN